ncbi:MAG: tRNA(Met) cytidine acetyltransferase TmcA domain-containing protein, partial [Gammaproteobacteria bacterium]
MQTLISLSTRLVAEAASSNHRRALVLAGDREWCVKAADRVLHAAGFGEVLWVSTQAPAGVRSIPAAAAHSMLGREANAVVFDAFSGFDPDAFGAVSGTVRGGGLLLLLCPPLDDWPHFDDPEHERIAVAPYRASDVTGRFLRHVDRVIREDENITVVEQSRDGACLNRGGSSSEETASTVTLPDHDDECRSADQRRAVDAIIKVVTGQRRRPVVLMSDRGRGKSAALGIAAARLLRGKIARIVVTGPSRDAAAPAFAHAQRLLSGAVA